MKNRIFRVRRSRLLLASFAALYVPAALSQTAPMQPLKEVTVTANRVQQDLQSAPFAAIVLTGDQIRASGAADANEAIRRLVGIPSRTDLRGGRNHSLDLMGYGATADQNVVVVVDGLRISENELATARLSAVSVEMIESIEIIRGGSSVQWGEGASAGIINIVLKKDLNPGLRGSASVQAESFSGRDARAQVSGGNGLVGFDINARSYQIDGYRDNSKNRQQTFSAGLNATIGAFTLRTRISSEDEKNRFPGALTFTQYAANPRQTLTPNDYGNYTETRVGAGLDYKLGAALTLGLDVGRRDRKSDGFFVGSSFNSSSQSTSTQLSPKLKYTDRFGASALTIVAGMDFNNADYRLVDNFGQNENAQQSNRAEYLTADLLLSTGTRITAGSRQEKVNKTAQDPVNFVSYDRNNSLSAWDLGINQALAVGFNVYGRTARAYRLPNLDENRYLAAALRPQLTRDREVGLKWKSSTASTAGVRVFRQNAVDEIAFDPAGGSFGFGANVNLDPTRRQGIEFNGATAITPRLNVSGSIQSVSAKFSQGPNSGLEIPLVSNLSAALRVDWQLDAHQQLGLGAQFLGRSRFGNDNANTCSRQIPSSTSLNARYAYKFDKVELSLAADNLTNKQSYSQAFSCVSGSLYPDPGRVIKVAAKYSF